jgi:hypothetical protein
MCYPCAGPGPASSGPSRLGFKLYYSLAHLLAGDHFNSFVAPNILSNLEGTPNIYAVHFGMKGGYYMLLNASIGFHFNDASGVDQVASGVLADFGPTTVAPRWTPTPATAYVQSVLHRVRSRTCVCDTFA